ncbi:MAG TPA: regulatory protein RecX [Gemmatimonadaceae bacterium]|nr:regulatory protein RecX [Gemmatimonadaceae bacterium]
MPPNRAPIPCYTRALDALARRARSSADLARWLGDRGYERDEIAETVSRLTATGLLDDARFAHAFARSRFVDGKQSRRRVQAELARHGVAREVADAAIATVVQDEVVDEEAMVRAVAERKYRTLARLDPIVARRRLMAFLARRGYDGDLVRRVAAAITG